MCELDKPAPLREEDRSGEEVFFGIKKAFNAIVLAYIKSMFSTPCHKAREIVIKPLLV